MKIISGKYKGKVLKRMAPVGVRPTQESVKESIFNTLVNLVDIENAIVADVCAGTGALGFEALSRGAKKVYFIDNGKQSVEYLKYAVKELTCEREDYEIISADALYGLKNLVDDYDELKFDIIFTDPPYQSIIPNELLILVAKSNLLADDGIIIVEISSAESLIVPNGLVIVKEKTYGGTKVVYISS